MCNYYINIDCCPSQTRVRALQPVNFGVFVVGAINFPVGLLKLIFNNLICIISMSLNLSSSVTALGNTILLLVAIGDNDSPTVNDEEEEEIDRTPQPQPSTNTESFRQYLKDRRNSKLNSNLSQQQINNNLTREELDLKRKMIDELKDGDAALNDSLAKMAKTMESVAGSMAMLATVMARNQQPNPQNNDFNERLYRL